MWERWTISLRLRFKIDNNFEIKENITKIIPIIIMLLFVLIIVFAVDFFYEGNIIKNNLMWIVPIFLTINLLLLIVSFVLSLKDFKKLLKKIGKKTWVFLIIIFLIGFSLRAFVAPHTHRIFYDEDVYLAIGKSIAFEGKAGYCTDGTPEECYLRHYEKQPNGYPFLVGIVFLFIGVNIPAVHYFNAIVSSFSIILVFLISFLLFENKKISLFSSLIFSLIPIAIIWAPTTSAGTIFIFFSGLTVFGFLSYFKKGSNKFLLFSFSSLAFAIQIRPEGFLLIFIIGAMFLLLGKDFLKLITKKGFIIVFLIFMLLITPHLIHLYSFRNDSWGNREGDRFVVETVEANLQENTLFFFENISFPVVFSILSLVGLAYKKLWREKLFLVFWFLVFFGIYIFFYAGNFNFYAGARFSLNLYIPIAILGGLGSLLIAKNISKIVKKKYIGLCIVILIILLSFVPFIGFNIPEDDAVKRQREFHEFVVNNLNKIENDSVILSGYPSVVLLNGKTNLMLYSDLDSINTIFKQSLPLYYITDYSRSYEHNLDATLNLEVYDSIQYGNYTVTFYKVIGWK